jgi:hypothetical protein
MNAGARLSKLRRRLHARRVLIVPRSSALPARPIPRMNTRLDLIARALGIVEDQLWELVENDLPLLAAVDRRRVGPLADYISYAPVWFKHSHEKAEQLAARARAVLEAPPPGTSSARIRRGLRVLDGGRP